MRFQGQPDHDHAQPARLGVLLVNLGTPQAPTTGAVRRYLREFLSDPRMVEVPRWLWWPLLNGVILPIRSPRSARAYAKVWTAQGSPLLVHSQALADGLDAVLTAALPAGSLRVALGMCYGQPSIPAALQQLRAAGMRRLLVLPLYPQYSATTTASVFDAVARELSTWRLLPELRMVQQYYNEPAYIEALAHSVRTQWAQHGRGEHLLLSFHGIPEKYCEQGDPYRCHVLGTFTRLRAALDLSEAQCSLAFQSRVGKQRWLSPYTEPRVRELAAAGVRRLDVLCPGFAVDCLETLEEIAVENAHAFQAAGGTELRYLPALNADATHVALLRDLVLRHVRGWPEADPAHDPVERARQIAAAAQQWRP